MATLYVKNVPKDLYEALRRRARDRHRSIAAEVLVLLEENIPTARQIRARRSVLLKLGRLRSATESLAASWRSTEEMQREDRSR